MSATVRRAAKRLRDAGHEREREDVPDLDDLEIHQRASVPDVAIWMHWDAEERASAVVAISEHAADEREQDDRQLLQKRVESEEERRLESEASETTSQFCATICIHVPMLDVQAPIHWTRKSR